MPASSPSPTSRRVEDPSLAAGSTDEARFAVWLQRTREAERAALARELHDELGAILTAARLDVAWMAAQPVSHDPAIADRLAALQRVLTQGIEFKRRVVEELHPTVLTHLGLVPALEQLIASHRMRFAGRVSVTLDPSIRLTGEPALAVYRIVQESLTNIQKYARADLVRITLRRQRGRIELSVDDDGAGFDTRAIGAGHHGLAGMRHRMLAIGGRLDVTSAVGAGTSIRASLPVAAGARSGAQAHREPRRPAVGSQVEGFRPQPRPPFRNDTPRLQP